MEWNSWQKAPGQLVYSSWDWMITSADTWEWTVSVSKFPTKLKTEPSSNFTSGPKECIFLNNFRWLCALDFTAIHLSLQWSFVRIKTSLSTFIYSLIYHDVSWFYPLTLLPLAVKSLSGLFSMFPSHGEDLQREVLDMICVCMVFLTYVNSRFWAYSDAGVL